MAVFQPNKQEIISNLQAMMTEALKCYKKQNNEYPNRVIVFRDGVGDGQLLAVKEHEIRSIKDCFQSLEIKPELVVAVVTKRIQQRFFKPQGSRLMNPSPGTVIDNQVTRDEYFDFYLIPQSVGQGTVTPTHYNIIEYESTLPPDRIQQLAYKLCHAYYNWTGTIRVPAVCQYAHKLAFLVGQSLHREPNKQLSEVLYFL